MGPFSCYLFAPAGRYKQDDLEKAKSKLKHLYSEVIDFPEKPEGYFAGSRHARIRQFKKILNLAEKSDRTPWLMPVRGGYGSIDILREIHEYQFLRPTVFSGFSDISVFHNWFSGDPNLSTVYGMNALHSFTGKIDDLSFTYQKRLIQNFENYQYDSDVTSQLKIIAKGNGNVQSEIRGGCLTVLLSTLGTKYFPDLTGKILFLEDVNEPVYAIDRMLNQLNDAGALDVISGVILGEFTGSKPQYGMSVWDVFEKYFGNKKYPVVAGFPMGHGEKHVPLKFSSPLSLEIAYGNRVEIVYL